MKIKPLLQVIKRLIPSNDTMNAMIYGPLYVLLFAPIAPTASRRYKINDFSDQVYSDDPGYFDPPDERWDEVQAKANEIMWEVPKCEWEYEANVLAHRFPDFIIDMTDPEYICVIARGIDVGRS